MLTGILAVLKPTKVTEDYQSGRPFSRRFLLNDLEEASASTGKACKRSERRNLGRYWMRILCTARRLELCGALHSGDGGHSCTPEMKSTKNQIPGV